MHVKKFSEYDSILSYSRSIMSSISMRGNIFPSVYIGKPFIGSPTRERERKNVIELTALTLGYGCPCCQKRRPSRNPAWGGPGWRPPPCCPNPTWRRFGVLAPSFRPLPRRRSPRHLCRRCRPIPDTIHHTESCHFRCCSEHRPVELGPDDNWDFRRRGGRFLKIKIKIIYKNIQNIIMYRSFYSLLNVN